MIGRRFGKLVVLSFSGRSKTKHLIWLCKCDCGNEKIIRGITLRDGRTKSCGCLHTRHGHRTGEVTSRTYRAWIALNTRCHNVNHVRYRNYGGRGITVCERWRKFENFLDDMGESPTNEHQIDRIDNDLGYCQANCRWVTKLEQARNTTKSRFLTCYGKTQCVSAWAEELGIIAATLHSRLKRGWSTAKTLTTPVAN